ncbi:MAG: glycosyltransferase [Fastidiosipilaceae bacterium]|jgi:colanic acid/amylovoran biosynthesis glycosyltransferase
MSHCLVVFTATFPAGTMDSFIHEELPYTAAQFDDVLIFPVNAVGALSRPDPRLPQNCVAYLTNQRGRIGGRLRDIAYLSGATFKRASYFLREREKKAKGIKNKIFLQYFEGRAAQASNDIWRVLEPLLRPYEKVTFYSYWLYVSCLTMLRVADRTASRYPDKEVALFSRAHGYDLYEDADDRGYLPYRQLFLRRLDGIFPCSADGVRHLEETWRQEPQDNDRPPVWLARLGMPAPEKLIAQLTPDERQELDRLLAARERDETVIELVTCAWIRPVKRVDLLVDALAALRGRSAQKWRWTHFGGAEKDADFKALEQRVAGDLDFMEVNLPGTRSRSFILSYYLEARPDLFVNTSYSEGVPVSIMEAMSASLPIYATDVGGTAEITGTEGVGKLWNRGVTAGQIAADLSLFAKLSADERAKPGHAARLRWDRICRAERNYRQFAEVLSGQSSLRNVPFESAEAGDTIVSENNVEPEEMAADLTDKGRVTNEEA